jgi:flagellar biosynthesis protein FliP
VKYIRSVRTLSRKTTSGTALSAGAAARAVPEARTVIDNCRKQAAVAPPCREPFRPAALVFALLLTFAAGSTLPAQDAIVRPDDPVRGTLVTPVSVRSAGEAFGVSPQTAAPLPVEPPRIAATAVGTDDTSWATAASPVVDSDAEESLTTLLTPEALTPTLRTVAVVGLVGLLPAALLMTTCFARFVIVLGLLRQGLGAQQWLPNQIVFALSLLLTLLVMAPVWSRSYEQGVRPWLEAEPADQTKGRQALQTAWTAAAEPVREFMTAQIAATGNEAAVEMLLDYQQAADSDAPLPAYYEQVPLSVLLPAYLLSELKTAFLIGFQIILPFLVIDLVVASVLTAMGLMMLPPVLVTLPFKLLLFVLIDGWTLSVELLLSSVGS